MYALEFRYFLKVYTLEIKRCLLAIINILLHSYHYAIFIIKLKVIRILWFRFVELKNPHHFWFLSNSDDAVDRLTIAMSTQHLMLSPIILFLYAEERQAELL